MRVENRQTIQQTASSKEDVTCFCFFYLKATLHYLIMKIVFRKQIDSPLDCFCRLQPPTSDDDDTLSINRAHHRSHMFFYSWNSGI